MRIRERLRAQAMVEVVLITPVLMLMVLGVAGLGVLTRTQMGIDAVAREAALSGALADSMDHAQTLGMQRGYAVGAGYHLSQPPLDVQVNASNFHRCGSVSAHATYLVKFNNAPLLSWAQFKLQSDHSEPVDGYRDQLKPNGTC